jgi:hypothetical protein
LPSLANDAPVQIERLVAAARAKSQEVPVPQRSASASGTVDRANRTLAGRETNRYNVDWAIKANRPSIIGPPRVLDGEIGIGREVVSPDGVVCYVVREKKPEQSALRRAA